MIAPPPPQKVKSPLQEWLVDGRKALGANGDEGKPEQLAAEMLAAGYRSKTGTLTGGTIRGWEASGPPPGAIPFLVRVFERHGYRVPPPIESAVSLTSLVAALHGQTLAITRLANALWPKPQTREEREAALVEQIASLTAELAMLQADDDPAPQAQPAPRRRTQG